MIAMYLGLLIHKCSTYTRHTNYKFYSTATWSMDTDNTSRIAYFEHSKLVANQQWPSVVSQVYFYSALKSFERHCTCDQWKHLLWIILSIAQLIILSSTIASIVACHDDFPRILFTFWMDLISCIWSNSDSGTNSPLILLIISCCTWLASPPTLITSRFSVLSLIPNRLKDCAIYIYTHMWDISSSLSKKVLSRVFLQAHTL